MDTFFQINLENGYILAAEDSMVQAKKLKFFFEANQINYLICKNGSEAYEAALNEKPVLIISDIIMPVMDGYEFCSRIKNNPDLNDIPVILLTSLSDPLDIIKGLQAGADNFITKPYEEKYLIARISYLIANRSFKDSGFGDMSIEIMFQNQKFKINSDKKQILDLLLSVYEAAISRNSQLIEAQHQLQILNEDLLAANEDLEAFAHTVSHDLRSPLNGMIGFADLLRTGYTDVLDDEAMEYIDWIIKSSQNMSQLINDLLQFSRSGRSEIDSQEIDMSKMAREVIIDMTRTIYQGNYNITIQDGITVFADQNMMRVVLNNLLGNALKYSQKSASPEITFGTTEMNDKQVLFVRDNGAGFDMDKADMLFRPFVRLHKDSEFQGTGVGLSTVKRIIERHGGVVWFDSTPGQGAIFYFTVN
ncbi:MAG: hybrid sensor histidine kinase/response regulator [Bacteroidetes bacterium CG_4_9_14_3_um_filter_41_19]|nr:MAG: hybrid sensor histidine kinase/response regulator [Bacteroidetes bacterium CG_4_9_14_3_um_filter_41_19]